MQDVKKIGEICNELVNELDRAANECGHGPFVSLHQGIAVIREEYLELEREVFKKERDWQALRNELTHLGAMVIKFRLLLDERESKNIANGCYNCGNLFKQACIKCDVFSNWKPKEE
jgi:NTP pyrophosphatase (non-canonical NTP hydrolase)